MKSRRRGAPSGGGPPYKGERKALQTRVPVALARRFSAVANAAGLTRSELLAEVVESKIDELESLYLDAWEKDEN